jgi:hypothetical protein
MNALQHFRNRAFLALRLPALRALAHKLVRRSDIAKWTEYKFEPEWALRSQRIAEFVPHGSHVFEFGAGASELRTYLHPSCSLISSDIVERTPGMMVLDLNRRPLPPLGGSPPRVAVFGGVLEYLFDVPAVLSWTAQYFERCIASYECAQPRSCFSGRVREVLGRAGYGWINHYTEAELIARFAEAGFQLADQSIWGTDDPGQIFVFQRSPQNGCEIPAKSDQLSASQESTG